jgi:hypothetical protein
MIPSFKKGDKVVMHTCYEATSEENKGKIFECSQDSFVASSGLEVVFLNGWSGYFFCQFLALVKL